LPSLSLGATDTLKLTFQVVEKGGSNKGVQPHQTFLRFHDEETGEEGIQPVRVTNAGKAKFELVCCFIIKYFPRGHSFFFKLLQNMAKPPPSLPPTTQSPIEVTLLLGSFTHSPAKIPLFSLTLPPSHPAPADPFTALPEITHSFRPEQKLPPRFISAVFAGMVLAPWVVLFGLVRLLLSCRDDISVKSFV
jgi:oligosaccharyltransferase complex subunit delta (ribophorin II)